MRLDIGDFGVTSLAMQSQSVWLEQARAMDRFKELDSLRQIAMKHDYGLSSYLPTQWDALGNCAAIAERLKSHNALMESISYPLGTNALDTNKYATGLLSADLFDKLNTVRSLGLATGYTVPDYAGVSATLSRIQGSLAVFNETSAIENTLKSINDLSKVNSLYEGIVSTHRVLFDRINPNITSWIDKSFLELRNIRGLDGSFKVNPDGSVSGFGSSIGIDSIRDIINAKIYDIESTVDDKSTEQKLCDWLESIGSRHPVIRLILVYIVLPAIIGIYINNLTDSSDKIIKHIDQQQAVLFKELKKEIKKQNIPSQILSTYRVVSTRQLSIKSSNSRDSKTVGTLYLGQVVVIVNKKRHWALVEYSRDNEDACIRGWVYTRYLGQLK